MAVLFDNANTEFLEVGSGANLSAVGFSISAHVNIDDLSSDVCFVFVGDGDVTNTHYRLMYDAADTDFQWTSRNSIGSASSNTSGTISANTWYQAGAVETSTSSRQAVLNGVKGTANTTTKAFVSAQDTVSIGRMGDSSPGKYMSGRICDVGIWDVALDQAEWDMLARGVSPLLVRPQNLIHYWPLKNLVYHDIVGGLGLADDHADAGGPPSTADSGILLSPDNVFIFPTATAAAGGPQIAAPSNGIIEFEGNIPSIEVINDLISTTGSIQFEGNIPTVDVINDIVPSVGEFRYLGSTATVDVINDVTPSVGSVEFEGNTA